MLKHDRYVTGVVTSHSGCPDMQVSIAKQLKQILDIDTSVRIGYLAHVRGLALHA